MIIENEKDVTKAVLSEVARSKNPRLREILSALVRHLHDFAREVKLTEEEFQAAIGYIVALGKHTTEKRSRADVRLARLLKPDLPPQQWQSRPDRNRRQSSRPVLAHEFTAHAEWRLDRPLAHARSGAVCPRRVPRREQQADCRRRGRYLAILAGRFLRKPGSGAGRHEFARQVHDRCGGSYQLPQRKAGGLSHSDRRPGRRNAARAGPPQYASRSPAFFGLQARLQNVDLATLRARRQAHRD